METTTNHSKSLNPKDIQTYVTNLEEMISERYSQLAEEEKRVERLKAEFVATHKVIASFKDPIKLNVGGKLFMTSKSTLTKQESMFSAMFSGRHQLEKGDDGAYFIDRSPKHFDEILSYLRDGEFELNDEENERKELLREAEFYCLTSLIQHLKGSTLGDSQPPPLPIKPFVAPANNVLATFEMTQSIRKDPHLYINGSSAYLDQHGNEQTLYVSTTFTTGVHSCTFSWSGDNRFMAGVREPWMNKFPAFTQIPNHTILLNAANGTMRHGLGGFQRPPKTKISGFTSPITIELDCDSKTATWIVNKGTQRHTETLKPIGPYGFCVSLWPSAGTVEITALN